MSDQKAEAQEAIFAGVARVAGEISDWSADAQAVILRDLAAAYRMAAGGPQPGGAVVDGKS